MLHRTLGETVQVSTVLGSGLGRTRADPGAIENALLNLAINARDAMPDGGNLTVATRNADLDANSLAGEMDIVPGSFVVLSVTDTGTGMTPEVRERALEPFFTTKEIGAGTGLGLSMIYGFAKQSGGYLRIYSEPGQGTTVSLYLPRIDEAERIIDEPILPEPQVGIAVERILVVEDDPRVREITVIRLKELGYTTLEADRGSAALEILKDNPSIDLLFTDLVMPGGMSGLDLADEARSLRPGLRVLFTTGYAQGAAICGPADSEASHLLRKPYSKQELAEKLREILET
jgi:two-component system CheB/CheR fusion protein